MLAAVNTWIEAARRLLAKEVQIPLIDSGEIDMVRELVSAWMFGEEGLRSALDHVLSRDLDDLAARFVALNAYYRLMSQCVPEEEEEVADQRRRLREHLGYLVRLRDASGCRDIVNIRWEIINACVVADFDRAVRLSAQLDGLLPPA